MTINHKLEVNVRRQSHASRHARFLCLAVCTLLAGCSANKEFKQSLWEQLWLDGTDALQEQRFVDARRLLEAAVGEAKAMHNSLRLGITLDRLGNAYAESQMDSEAEKTYRESIAQFDKSLKDDKTSTNEKLVLKEQVAAIGALARILVQQKKYKEAEQMLNRAIMNGERLGGVDMSRTKDKMLVHSVGICLQKLGFVYEHTGRKRQAEQVYVKASKLMPDLVMEEDGSSLFRSIATNDSPSDVTSLSATESHRLNEMIRRWATMQEAAKEAERKDDLVNAQMRYQKAYDIAREYSQTCDQAVDSLGQLIRVTNRLGQYPVAKRLTDEGMAVFERATPTKPIDNVLGYFCKVYQNDKEWDKAERALKLRIKVRETLRGENNFHVAETLYDLGELYQQAGRVVQAEFVLRRAMKIMQSNNQEDHHLSSKITVKLDELRLSKGKP